MKTRTLLVDSNYLLKRSFHGAKTAYTDKFGHIGGLYMFYTTLRRLIREYKINKIVLCWDGENSGLMRNRISRDYKANRKSKEWHKKIVMSDGQVRREEEKDRSILKQRKRIQQYAEELYIRQIEIDEIEADDLIAQYCIDYHDKEEIYIYSNDRDFSQLLDLDITILFPNIDKPITRKNYLTQFGHHYTNALTMKILCGDVSDNIKGVDGIQETTLLKHFPDLRVRHVSVREICKKSVSLNEERVLEKKKALKKLEKITESLDLLKTNYKLMNLKSPILNEEAIDELEQLEMPLSSQGRSSKNLYKMMVEDDFLFIYGSSFVSYVEPFYSVIMHEKQLLKEFNEN